MSTKHLPGPWEVRRNERGYCIRSASQDGAIADVWGNSSNGERDANARRIVACVNACEGISTEALEREPGYLGHSRDELRAERDSLKALNQELVEALESARRVCNMPVNMLQARRGERAAEIERIDAALAKAKEQS